MEIGQRLALRKHKDCKKLRGMKSVNRMLKARMPRHPTLVPAPALLLPCALEMMAAMSFW